MHSGTVSKPELWNLSVQCSECARDLQLAHAIHSSAPATANSQMLRFRGTGNLPTKSDSQSTHTQLANSRGGI
jgi:hypothetical protein